MRPGAHQVAAAGSVLEPQARLFGAGPGGVPAGRGPRPGLWKPPGDPDLRPGETVIDLGSGAGFDCFLAAKRVVPGGSVIGIDDDGVDGDQGAKQREESRDRGRGVPARRDRAPSCRGCDGGRHTF